MDEINARLKRGESPEAVSAWLDRLGTRFALSGKSLRLHRQRHLMTAEEQDKEARIRDLRRASRGVSGDLAALVRDRAQARMEAGDLTPTLAEGLRAQEQLDRRADASEGRDFMLQMAAILSGAYVPPQLAPPDPWLSSPERRAEQAEDERLFAALGAGETVIRPLPPARERAH